MYDDINDPTKATAESEYTLKHCPKAMRARMGEQAFERFAMFKLHNELAKAWAAIGHRDYSHSRAGDRLFRDATHIYHVNKTSPTGVTLYCTLEREIAEHVLRLARNNSPLSPTEGKRGSR